MEQHPMLCCAMRLSQNNWKPPWAGWAWSRERSLKIFWRRKRFHCQGHDRRTVGWIMVWYVVAVLVNPGSPLKLLKCGCPSQLNILQHGDMYQILSVWRWVMDRALHVLAPPVLALLAIFSLITSACCVAGLKQRNDMLWYCFDLLWWSLMEHVWADDEQVWFQVCLLLSMSGSFGTCKDYQVHRDFDEMDDGPRKFGMMRCPSFSSLLGYTGSSTIPWHLQLLPLLLNCQVYFEYPVATEYRKTNTVSHYSHTAHKRYKLYKCVFFLVMSIRIGNNQIIFLGLFRYNIYTCYTYICLCTVFTKKLHKLVSLNTFKFIQNHQKCLYIHMGTYIYISYILLYHLYIYIAREIDSYIYILCLSVLIFSLCPPYFHGPYSPALQIHRLCEIWHMYTRRHSRLQTTRLDDRTDQTRLTTDPPTDEGWM